MSEEPYFHDGSHVKLHAGGGEIIPHALAALRHPWVLLGELKQAPECVLWLETERYAARFLKLLAPRTSQMERDALLAEVREGDAA